ncbi:MAG: hypothetical protein CL878_14745 [Dehalococcoidia bacterium]|nr:hypothetical protein [Dehalococcoidia bacterium]
MAKQNGESANQRSTNPSAPGWRLWLWWVVANFIGAFVGFMWPGVGVGIAQWLVLRRHVAVARWWVGSTILGIVVSGAVGVAVWTAIGMILPLSYSLGPLLYGQLVAGSIWLGAAIGLVQWPLLRRHVPRAGWWVAASSVGVVMGAGAALGAGVATVVLLDDYLGWVAPAAPTPTHGSGRRSRQRARVSIPSSQARVVRSR